MDFSTATIMSGLLGLLLLTFEVYRIMKDDVNHYKRRYEDLKRTYDALDTRQLYYLTVIDDLNKKIKELKK